MIERCRTCKYFNLGKCEKDLPIEIELDIVYQVDNGELAMRIRDLLDEYGLNLNADEKESFSDDVERIVSNLSDKYQIRVNEDFKCKYYE